MNAGGVAFGDVDGVDEVVGGKEDEGAADEDFVDERIDDAAEGGFDLPAAGEVAIDDIGEGGDDEEGEGDPHLVLEIFSRAWAVDVEEEEKDDGQGEAGEGDEIGDVAVHGRECTRRGRGRHGDRPRGGAHGFLGWKAKVAKWGGCVRARLAIFICES